MLYTSQEQEGGARRRPVGPTEEQRKAALYKSKIAERDPAFLDKFMKEALRHSPKTGNDVHERVERMLTMVRRIIGNTFKDELGVLLSKEVADAVTKEQVVEWLKGHQRKIKEDKEAQDWDSLSKDDIIEIAFNSTRGSLAATLKRAQLLRKGIKMEDVKRWRLEHQNKEKKTNRKSYNSWVANKKQEEYQVDLFYFMDLKKKQAIEELRKESDKINPEEAAAIGGPAEEIARNFSLVVAAKSQPKPKRQQILKRIKELTWEYETGLMVVDIFTKQMAVVPMKTRNWPELKKSLEAAFRRLGGKPASIYSDAEAALTSKEAQEYFRHNDIVQNITLGHAPVAERMIGVIKADIVHYLNNRSKDKKWWDVVDSVVKEYNEEHVSRSTKMTPIEAAKDSNRDVVKMNLEAVRKMDNPQDKIHVGDQVRVMVKKKFDKSYVPDWTDKLYKVEKVKAWNHPDLPWQLHPHDPQVKYYLEDPNKDLPRYKPLFMRHELLLTKKH